MPAAFAYGRRDGRLVHVHELDEDGERGLRCGCVCPQCGRPLQAHLGQKKSWHFQHQVEDASCSPQPMTLLHAFVRDELAAKRQLHVPAVRVLSELQVFGKPVFEFVSMPASDFDFIDGRSEVQGDGVQPDVLFQQADETMFALEVRYSHAVDEEKLQRLKRNYRLAIEFDVSDLPPSGVTREQLEQVLLQPRRWKWLVNTGLLWEQSLVQMRLEWEQTVWSAGAWFKKQPETRSATQKLKAVQKRLAWAEDALTMLRHQAMEGDDAADWLAKQEKGDRVAVACAALRLDPRALPDFMQQSLPNDKPRMALNHHPWSWQPLVFMKFCARSATFGAHQAAAWVLKAMPDRCEYEDGTKSRNGFTRTAAALQLYFLQLEAQGLLVGSPGAAREDRTFTSRFGSVGDLRGYLREQGVPA